MASAAALLQPVAWVAVLALAGAAIVSAGQVRHEAYFDAQVHISAARAVLRGESPYGVYYQSPLWTAFFVAPFALLPDPLAYAAWYWGNVTGWLIAAGVLLWTLRVRRPLSLAGGAAGLALFPPVLWSTHGQVDVLLALGLAGYAALARRHPGPGGALLALTSVKPHLAVVPVMMAVVWAMREDRRTGGAGELRNRGTAEQRNVRLAPGMLAGLVAGMGLLGGAAFAVQPDWLGEWAGQVLQPPAEIVAGRARFAPTVAAFAGLWLPGGDTLGTAIAVAGILALGSWVCRVSLREPVLFLSMGCAALFVISPYSQGYDLSLLVFPLALLASNAFREGVRFRFIAAGCVVLVYALPVADAFAGLPQPVLLLCAAPCLAATAAAGVLRADIR